MVLFKYSVVKRNVYMFAISPIKLDFKQTDRNSSQSNACSFSCNNLAPLKKDTVSFGNVKHNKILTSRANSISISLAKNIRAEAESDFIKFERTIKKILKPFTSTSSSPNKTIDSFSFRLKSVESIVEKAGSLETNNKDAIKRNFSDLIGGRIVLKDTSKEKVNEIIEALTKAVKNGEIKIKEIENYRPEHKYEYASNNVLRKLEKECVNWTTDFNFHEAQVPTGYMAIHLGVETPNKFLGELQIMGKGVEQLKELEDIFYKIKNNKNIDKKYKPIATKLKDLATNEPLRRAFNAHTKEQYIYARKNENKKSYVPNVFLKHPDFLDAKYDFNRIFKMKTECDNKAKILTKGKK